MTSTVQQRAFKNSLVGYLSFFITIFVNVFSVPIILNFWGNERYGIWLALLAGTTILKSLDTGHITFIGNEINLLYHNDKERLKVVLGSSVLISLLLGGIQLIICLLLIFFNQLNTVLGLSSYQLEFFNTKGAFLILITVWLFIGSFGGIIHRLFIPTGLLYQSQWWGILFQLSQFLSIIGVVISGGSIIQVAIGYSLIQAIIFGLSFIYIKNKVPEFYPWWIKRSLKTGIANFKKSIILSANTFIQQLSTNGIILFISNYFTATLIPAYTTIRTLTNTAGSISNISVNALIPDIVRYHANKEPNKIKKIIYTNWLITGFVLNTGIIIFLPFIISIFRIWTGGHLQFNLTLFLFLASGISLVNFGSGLYFYLVSINNLFAQTVITVSRIIVVFFVSYFTMNTLGLAAIGLGVLLSEIISSFVLPLLFVNKQLGIFRDSLDYKFIIISVLPPLILISISVFFLYSNVKLISLAIISFIAIFITYYINWKLMDDDVKFRLKELLKGYVWKILSFRKDSKSNK